MLDWWLDIDFELFGYGDFDLGFFVCWVKYVNIGDLVFGVD